MASSFKCPVLSSIQKLEKGEKFGIEKFRVSKKVKKHELQEFAGKFYIFFIKIFEPDSVSITLKGSLASVS